MRFINIRPIHAIWVKFEEMKFFGFFSKLSPQMLADQKTKGGTLWSKNFSFENSIFWDNLSYFCFMIKAPMACLLVFAVFFRIFLLQDLHFSDSLKVPKSWKVLRFINKRPIHAISIEFKEKKILVFFF